MKVIKIACTDKNEAGKLEKKILKYIAKIAPKIECASIGYATKRMDVTKRMREIVDLRDLSVIQKIGGSDIVKHLHGDAALKKKDKERKYTQTLSVTYTSKLGKRTKLFEDECSIVELD